MRVLTGNLVNVWAAATHQVTTGRTRYYVDTDVPTKRLDSVVPIRAADKAPSCKDHIAMIFDLVVDNYDTLVVLIEFWKLDIQCTGVYAKDAPLERVECDLSAYQKGGLYNFQVSVGDAYDKRKLPPPKVIFINPTLPELLEFTDERILRPIVPDAFFSEKRTEDGHTYYRPNYAKLVGGRAP